MPKCAAWEPPPKGTAPPHQWFQAGYGPLIISVSFHKWRSHEQNAENAGVWSVGAAWCIWSKSNLYGWGIREEAGPNLWSGLAPGRGSVCVMLLPHMWSFYVASALCGLYETNLNPNYKCSLDWRRIFCGKLSRVWCKLLPPGVTRKTHTLVHLVLVWGFTLTVTVNNAWGCLKRLNFYKHDSKQQRSSQENVNRLYLQIKK